MPETKRWPCLLAKYDVFTPIHFESVDVYTKQCSVGVNATQLARMGATLANNGVNPATGEQVIKSEDIPYILSTMTDGGTLRRFRWLGLARGSPCEERSRRRNRRHCAREGSHRRIFSAASMKLETASRRRRSLSTLPTSWTSTFTRLAPSA